MQQHPDAGYVKAVEQRFAQSLAKYRAERGWSLRALSEAIEEGTGIKIDPSGLNRLESGERAPRLNEAVAISLTLDVDLSHLLLTEAMEVRAAAGLLSESLTHIAERISELANQLAYAEDVVTAITDGAKREVARDYLQVDLLREVVESLREYVPLLEKVASRYRHPSYSGRIDREFR